MIIFGPIPSRRLGHSLGINNIPHKVCSFNCVYCQVGRTTDLAVERREFFPPQEVYDTVAERVQQLREAGTAVDYLSFVPDGEPTLDVQLGESIARLKPLGIPIAVFTNSTHLWDERVRRELAGADLVSVKVDAVEELAWKKVNRPNKHLSLAQTLQGVRQFAREYEGELITETMLVAGINDHESNLRATAEFIREIQPATAYIAIPTRPTAVGKAQAPDEHTHTRAYQVFSDRIDHVECLFGFSPEDFPLTGSDVVQEMLDIFTVHPMRESEAVAFLRKGGVGKEKLDELVKNGTLVRVRQGDQFFYALKLKLQPV